MKRLVLPFASALFAVSVFSTSCSIDQGLKKTFRTSSIQSFTVEVTSYASDVPKGRKVWIQNPSDRLVARKTKWNPMLIRALAHAKYTEAKSEAVADLIISYRVKFDGSGVKDWLGSYTRRLDLDAVTPKQKKIWEVHMKSTGPFDYSDDRLFAVLAASGIDYFGTDSQGTKDEKVHEDNSIVTEIRGTSIE